MKKGLALATIFLIITAFLIAGCANKPTAEFPVPAEENRPAGMKSLRWLTENEKTKMVEIALNTPEALKYLKDNQPYKTYLSWIAIDWYKAGSSYWGLDYDWVEEKILPPPPKALPPDVVMSAVPESAEFYSRVIINFGEPPKWQVGVAINPDTGKVAMVEENPYRTGPTPPK